MMLALVAAVPVKEYLEEKRFTRFVVWTALVGGAMLVLTEAGISHSTSSIPGLPLFQFGQLGPDAASMFPAIGVIAFLVELSRPRPSQALVPRRVRGAGHDPPGDTAARRTRRPLPHASCSSCWPASSRRVATFG